MCQKLGTIVLALLLTVLHKSQSHAREHRDNHISSIHYGTNESNCPPWFIYNSTTEKCECGNSLGGVVNCNSEYKTVYIINCYCMTQDDHLGVAVDQWTKVVKFGQNLKFL